MAELNRHREVIEAELEQLSGAEVAHNKVLAKVKVYATDWVGPQKVTAKRTVKLVRWSFRFSDSP